MKKKKRKKNKIEYSKRATSIILGVALFDIQLTYVLAFVGMAEVAETLSVALVTEVIGVFSGYLIRAYLGKRNEEANKLEEMQMDKEQNGDTTSLD